MVKNTQESDHNLISGLDTAVDQHISSRFTRVYATNLWEDAESKSGPGSRNNSPEVIESIQALEYIVDAYQVKSLVDIPCGDLNWIKNFVMSRADIEYYGFDIVAPLIEHNKSVHPDINCAVLDVVTSSPPKVDLVFSKDLIIHLNDNDIIKMLNNIKLSGSKYLLASNNFGLPNSDLLEHIHGDSACRYVDILAYPFKCSPPIWRSNFLGLWKLSDMQIIYNP